MHHLLLLGASSRAAAWSLRRSGWELSAADLFADEDLRQLCPTRQVLPFPEGYLACLAESSATGWLYTGVLENYPDLVDSLAEVRPLYGIPGKVLRRVRDPFQLGSMLRSAHFFAPRVQVTLPVPRRCLRKPYRSGGGQGIVFAEGKRRTSTAGNAECETDYFQEFVDGSPASVIFFSDGTGACVLGLTEQLTGLSWLGARGFQYCGSIGPLQPPADLLDELARLGNFLVRSFGLRGLFGVDLILQPDQAWVIEVNPRYTASIEVLERAFGTSLLQQHVRHFIGEPTALPPPGPVPTNSPCWGKAILYARLPVIVGTRFFDLVGRWNSEADEPLVADISALGTRIEPGKPVTTVFSQGGDVREVRRNLQERARQVELTLS